MSKVRATDTGPELALRKELFARGLRYRIHVRALTGRPDILFLGPKVAVFVDGDFWHGGGWRERGLSGFEDQFQTNRDFWVKKIGRNIARDLQVNSDLNAMGWKVLRILESAIKADVRAQAFHVEALVRSSRAESRPRASSPTNR